MAHKEPKEKKQLKGDALVNKVALIVIEVINAALILGYISDYMTGTSTISYFAIFELAAIATFITVIIVYLKKPDILKYVAFVCFAIVYMIGIIGAHIDVAFVMAFPIVVVFVLYYDYKLMKAMAITFSSICVADILYIVFGLKKQHSGLEINSSILLMEFLGTVIFLIAATVVTKISKQNNEDKLATIQAATDRLNESIKNINSEITQLNKSSLSVQEAMDDINSGITSTAEAVQYQLSQTEAIQDRIESVKIAADNISENVSRTLTAVGEGDADVAGLVSQAERSVDISNKVSEDLEILKNNIESMSSITQMIENIAFQTNIMAINANIEAAHAGEAGRGFAVVASEISSMANQTKEATENIGELITNAGNSLGELVTSIDEMAAVIESEQKQTNQTSEAFGTIRNSTDEVKENVSLFIDYLAGLTEANREIIQSVQTISASAEEVTALANEAMNKEHDNAAAVESIATQVRELAEN